MSDSSATAATMMADVAMNKSPSRAGNTSAHVSDGARTHVDADRPDSSTQKRESLGRGGLVRLMVLPAATLIALAIHEWVPDVGQIQRSNAYPRVLLTVLCSALVLAALAGINGSALRRWVLSNLPLMAAGILIVAIWELITIKLGLLPIMYFPPPERILSTLYTDRAQLFNSTWHSLTLLVLGYIVGVMSGLLSGIMIGWSGGVRYWGMPVLKIIGPIPATAWIPLALVMFPQSISAGVFLISLSVWFPVTMLTASGVSNVRASYLDVARTLGAGRRYLIFKVAIPAAMPSIFIGLFMGLGTSFVTLLVAESTGVSSGLGWYIDWARNYSDYAKVFAALVIMAVFFSTIMSVLFMVRDRVLVWQKGVIKW